jgi:biotin transport system substrate-specific component
VKDRSVRSQEKPQKTNREKFRKSAAREMAYIAVSVALITICAWISVPVLQVPYTLQTLAVALIGALMGWKRGVAAVAVYILMGLAGIPVFSNFNAGAGVLFGATGGYIFGFLFAVVISGLFKMIPIKNKWGRTAMLYGANIIGLSVCYFFGRQCIIVVLHMRLRFACCRI